MNPGIIDTDMLQLRPEKPLASTMPAGPDGWPFRLRWYFSNSRQLTALVGSAYWFSTMSSCHELAVFVEFQRNNRESGCKQRPIANGIAEKVATVTFAILKQVVVPRSPNSRHISFRKGRDVLEVAPRSRNNACFLPLSIPIRLLRYPSTKSPARDSTDYYA